jgi:hypothetical protein
MTTETTEYSPAKTTRTTAPKTTGAPAVYAALHKVQEGLASIPKRGEMKFGSTSYSYLKADDVQEKINPLLQESGLVVKSDYTVDTLLRGRGEGSPYVYVNLSLTYISIQDGSEMTVTAVGESAAQDDKSINKALTQAIKNAHRATFQFASGEREPDDFPARDVPASEPRAVAAQRSGGNNPSSGAAVSSDVAEINALKKELTAFVPSGESAPKWLSSQAEAHLPAKDDGTWDGWDRNVNALTALRDALKKQAG